MARQRYAAGEGEEGMNQASGIHYASRCDPRLNARQSLDLAFEVAELPQPEATS